MKATFFFPAHPSYFDDEYTQQEIDQAIKVYDSQMGGGILNHRWLKPFDHEFVLLRSPGKAVTVRFDSTGLKDDRAVDQYRQSSIHDLGIYVQNVKTILQSIRQGADQ